MASEAATLEALGAQNSSSLKAEEDSSKSRKWSSRRPKPGTVVLVSNLTEAWVGTGNVGQQWPAIVCDEALVKIALGGKTKPVDGLRAYAVKRGHFVDGLELEDRNTALPVYFIGRRTGIWVPQKWAEVATWDKLRTLSRDAGKPAAFRRQCALAAEGHPVLFWRDHANYQVSEPPPSIDRLGAEAMSKALGVVPGAGGRVASHMVSLPEGYDADTATADEDLVESAPEAPTFTFDQPLGPSLSTPLQTRAADEMDRIIPNGQTYAGISEEMSRALTFIEGRSRHEHCGPGQVRVYLANNQTYVVDENNLVQSEYLERMIEVHPSTKEKCITSARMGVVKYSQFAMIADFLETGHYHPKLICNQDNSYTLVGVDPEEVVHRHHLAYLQVTTVNLAGILGLPALQRQASIKFMGLGPHHAANFMSWLETMSCLDYLNNVNIQAWTARNAAFYFEQLMEHENERLLKWHFVPENKYITQYMHRYLGGAVGLPSLPLQNQDSAHPSFRPVGPNNPLPRTQNVKEKYAHRGKRARTTTSAANAVSMDGPAGLPATDFVPRRIGNTVILAQGNAEFAPVGPQLLNIDRRNARNAAAAAAAANSAPTL